MIDPIRKVRPHLNIGEDGSRRAFTLIELLIVIAIILILIAIALPNFLEAQIRARVTKAKGEIRSLGIALESYRLDWKFYPGRSLPDYKTPFRTRAQVGLAWLTSPIKYMTALPDDPFALGIDAHDGGGKPRFPVRSATA